MAKLAKTSFGKNSTNGKMYATNILSKAKAGGLEVFIQGKQCKKLGQVTTIGGKALSMWKADTLNQYIADLGSGDTGNVVSGGVSYNIVGDKGIKKETITESDNVYPMGNRGGIAEGIYAAAIYLRFMSKAKDRAGQITEQQVQNFIYSNMKSNTGKITGQAPNLGTTIKDDIELKYGLKVKDHNALMDERMWPHWRGEAVNISGFKEIKKQSHNMIRAALNYVNNTTPGRSGQPQSVMNWAKQFYENGVYNTVKVEAEGEVAQDETKIDIRVSANNHDGKEINDIMSISLKYGGIGQFGQMAGVSYEITADVFKQWFGITSPSFSKASFERKLVTKEHKQDAAQAMFEMWQAEKDNLTRQLRDNPDTFRMTFWKHISQGKNMVREEPGVELVDAFKQDSTIYKLDIIKEIDFSNMSLEAKWEVSKATGKTAGGGMSHAPFDLCKTTISGMIGDKRQDLLVIRVKRGDSNSTGPYYRTIFEKQKGLGLLIEDAKRVWETR